MIPKILHFMYMWQTPQDWMRDNVAEFADMNPDWEIRFIESVPDDFPQRGLDALELAPTPRFKADLVRYWLLWTYGGVYCDIDTRPINPLSDLVDNIQQNVFYCRYRSPHIPDNFFIGGTPAHQFWFDAYDVACQPQLWKNEVVHFGAYNAYLRVDKYDDVLWLPPEATLEIQAIKEYDELFVPSRVPLVGEATIKHYRVCGMQTPTQIETGWQNPMSWEDNGTIYTAD